MKVPSHKAGSASEQRRYHLQADRAKVSTVRDVFPLVEAMHVELIFDDRHGHVPSSQTHSLYPGARAFFRFACPCADCDGDFDLTPTVTELMRTEAAAKSATGSSVSGRTVCQGTRLRDSSRSKPCQMELNFRIVTTLRAVAATVKRSQSRG